jgi:hypothetical protein
MDIEASGLYEDSYPIEIAWSVADGSVERHMLRVDDIPEWTTWSDAGQVQHEISPRMLSTHGEPPRAVAQRMNEALGEATVYVDALAWDQAWINTLFDAVGVEPTFRLASLTEGLTRWMTHEQLKMLLGGPGPHYADVEEAAERRRLIRQMEACARGELDPERGFALHDAYLDVIRLQEFYHLAVHYETGSILIMIHARLQREGDRWYVVDGPREVDLPAKAVDAAGVSVGDEVLVTTGGAHPRVHPYNQETVKLLEAIEDTKLRLGGALERLAD